MSTTLIDTKQAALAILREGREKVASGWTQGQYVKTNAFGDASYCSVGALSAASVDGVGYLAGYRQAYSALVDTIYAMHGGLSIVGFNDAPGRTQAEVVAVFDAAIERLEAQQ